MNTPTDQTGPCGRPDADSSADNKSQAQIDYDEGRGYVERGEAALAAVALHNALRGFEQEENREGIANAANQLGHACMIRKDYDTALTHYRRAWDICEELGDHLSLMALARQLVETRQALGNYDEALDLCLYMLNNYQKDNNPKGSVEVLEMMAAVYVDAEQPGKAADALRTAASIHANFKHNTIAGEFRRRADELAKEVG